MCVSVLCTIDVSKDYAVLHFFRERDGCGGDLLYQVARYFLLHWGDRVRVIWLVAIWLGVIWLG